MNMLVDNDDNNNNGCTTKFDGQPEVAYSYSSSRSFKFNRGQKGAEWESHTPFTSDKSQQHCQLGNAQRHRQTNTPETTVSNQREMRIA